MSIAAEAYSNDDTLPVAIAKLFEKNKDVMPMDLPKKLPSRREVGHHIELELDVKPSTMVPYRIAPPKLEELWKQLMELVETRRIRPSKVLYSASVLF